MTPQTHHVFPVIPVVRSAPRSRISSSSMVHGLDDQTPTETVCHAYVLRARRGGLSIVAWLVAPTQLVRHVHRRTMCRAHDRETRPRIDSAVCTVPTAHSTLFSAGRNSTQHLIAIATVPHTARRVAYLGLFANPVSKIGNHRTLYRTVLANARRAGGHPWHDP